MESLSQNQIDDLLEKYSDKSRYIEESYHHLICIHCGEIIRFFDLSTHCFLSGSKCKNRPFTCTYVSVSWLQCKKTGQYGWNREDTLTPDIKTQKVPKGIDGEAINKKREKVKKYIRSPSEKVIYSCGIWNHREL